MGAEDCTDLVCELGGRGLEVHERVGEAELTPLELTHLVEGEHVHPFHVAEAGSIAGEGSDVVQLVGEARHQHIAQPHGGAAFCQLFCKVEGGLQGLAGDQLVLLRVPGFDIEQHQVGIGQYGVVGIAAEVAGGIEAGVQTHFLAATEQGSGEIRLEEGVATADGHAAFGIFEESGIEEQEDFITYYSELRIRETEKALEKELLARFEITTEVELVWEGYAYEDLKIIRIIVDCQDCSKEVEEAVSSYLQKNYCSEVKIE